MKIENLIFAPGNFHHFVCFNFTGYIIYFAYGIRHSEEGELVKKEKLNEAKLENTFYHVNRIALMPNEKISNSSYKVATIA